MRVLSPRSWSRLSPLCLRIPARRAISAVAGCLLLVTLARATTPLDSLYQSGELEGLSAALRAPATSPESRADSLYYAALLTADAATARDLLGQAEGMVRGNSRHDVILSRLAELYILTNDTQAMRALVSLVEERETAMRSANLASRLTLVYERIGDSGAASRLAILSAKQEKEKDPTLSRLDQFRLGTYPGPEKRSRALGTLVKEAREPYVPVALYMAAIESIHLGRTEDALSRIGMLDEAYSGYIGEDSLLAAVAALADAPPAPGPIPHVRYPFSIQVGVFSIETNARSLASRFASEEDGVTVEKRDVAGKPYYFVLVGSYRTRAEVDEAKARLERERSEKYRIYAR